MLGRRKELPPETHKTAWRLENDKVCSCTELRRALRNDRVITACPQEGERIMGHENVVMVVNGERKWGKGHCYGEGGSRRIITANACNDVPYET